jgi:hypothetical protein
MCLEKCHKSSQFTALIYVIEFSHKYLEREYKQFKPRVNLLSAIDTNLLEKT